MVILKESWTKDVQDDEVKSTYQYVMDLWETCRIATGYLQKAEVKQKKYSNRKTKVRNLKAGDKVLVLLSTKSNKLLMQWRGPFYVVERMGSSDYRIDRDGKIKTLHVNLLKKYVEPRNKDKEANVNGILGCISTTVLHEDAEECEGDKELETLPSRIGKVGVEYVVVAKELTTVQMAEVQDCGYTGTYQIGGTRHTHDYD